MNRPSLVLALLLLLGCAATPVPRGRAFWVGLQERGFAVPAGADADALFAESEALLGVADPVLRDEVGYGLSVAWVLKQRRVSPEALRAHAGRLVARLVASAGAEPGAALERSFAALRLSVVAAADAREPLLDDAGFAALVGGGTAALARETDYRGYDPELGWIHPTAHLADLLKFAARSPRLSAPQQAAVYGAVTARLARGSGFAWGEDERLAQVLRSLVLRADADPAPLEAWLATLPPQWKALWGAPALDVARYRALDDAKRTLRALLFFLDAQEKPGPVVERARQRVLEALAALL
jgi:hypothetical protein